jgi:predicted esterase
LIRSEKPRFAGQFSWLAATSAVERKPRGQYREFDVPQIYARLGDTQKALALLNRNDQERRALAFGPAIRESRSAHGAHSQRQG